MSSLTLSSWLSHTSLCPCRTPRQLPRPRLVLVLWLCLVTPRGPHHLGVQVVSSADLARGCQQSETRPRGERVRLVLLAPAPTQLPPSNVLVPNRLFGAPGSSPLKDWTWDSPTSSSYSMVPLTKGHSSFNLCPPRHRSESDSQ